MRIQVAMPSELLRWATYGTQLIQVLYIDNATTASNALFQSCHWECFHNLSCWLGLDLDDLSEDFPFASFCCWFCADLQACQSWDGEDTSLLYVCRGYLCKPM